VSQLRSGDGGIQTTPSQLVHWADNYRTGRVGGADLLNAQLSGAVPTEPGGADKYGAGIYLLANGMLDHDGAWSGFVTAFRVSKDRTTSLAISCNTDKQDPEALADSLAKVGMWPESPCGTTLLPIARPGAALPAWSDRAVRRGL